MAGPPFSLDITHPASSDIISAFPTNEQTFRSVVSDWLNTISDASTGLLKPTAFQTPFTLESTDAGATQQPTLTLWRNSVSPAPADILGGINFDGEDSGSNQTTYAALTARIDDAVNGTEDGSFVFSTVVAGTLTQIAVLNRAGFQGLIQTSVDNTIPRWDGTIGLLQGSTVTIDDSNNVTAAGGFQANTHIFAANASTMILRPNGLASSTGQLTIATNGDVAVSGQVGSNIFTGISGNVIFAGNGILFRPNGSGSGTGQVTIDAAGTLAVGGGTGIVAAGVISGNVDVILGAATGHAVILRANGYSSATNQGIYDSSGNFTAAGNITANSDERLKSNWNDLSDGLIQDLAGVKHGTFDYNFSGTRGIGVSAQSLQKIMPEAVLDGPTGFLSVNYGAAALVGVIALSKKILELEAKLA